MTAVNNGKIQATTAPTGSVRDAAWWRFTCEYSVIQRVGVPVVFWPRQNAAGAKLRGSSYAAGDCGRVVLAPVEDGVRYPGEVCLWSVTPGALTFGESWIASGDLLVVDELLQRILRGGAHL